MSNLAYGAHRTNFTDHLPRPNPAAFLVKPSQVFGGLAPHRKAAAVKASEKPEGHKPIRITRKITNITNASSIIIRRSAATAEQVAKASVLPIPQQSPEIGKVNTESMTAAFKSSADAHRALMARRREEREAEEQKKAAKRSKKAPR
jgi:hypothetical protein